MFRWYVVKSKDTVYGWSTKVHEAATLMAKLVGSHDVSMYTYESKNAPVNAFSKGELVSKS